MAKKNSAGSGLIIGLLAIIGFVASLPGEHWVFLVVLAIAAWLIHQFSKKNGTAQMRPGAKPNPEASSGQATLNPAVTSSDRDTKRPELLVRVTVSGARESTEYSIPTAPAGLSATASWVPPSEIVTVAGFRLSGGMIYVGTGLKSGFYDVDPALINPELKLAVTEVDVSLPLTDYWPSYSTVSPEARKAYLKWLSDGRRNPAANIGYVFLFFYGLERRILVDGANSASLKGEIAAIEAEVRRLLAIYGGNNSFRRYASRLLAYITSEAVDEILYLRPPPAISEPCNELPLRLRIGLGQLAVDRKPLPSDWALAWALADPNIIRRTAVQRCSALFAQSFKQRYAETYGDGFTLQLNRTKLKASYGAASAGLSHLDFSRTIGDLPDVTVVKMPITRLQELVNECAAALDPYSRYIGRNPDKAEALEGMLLLPATLWPMPIRADLDSLKSQIGDGMAFMSFGELSGRLKSDGALTRDKAMGLARALESMHLGLEPDILAGAKTPKSDDRIALFATHPEDGIVRAGAAYTAAAVTLDLACIAALADGEASAHELVQISGHVDSWSHLSEAHRKRLKAHMQLGIGQPATLASLRKRLESLPTNAKQSIARFLAHLVQADGKVTPEEIKFLERVYKMLALEVQQVYSDLHVQASTGTPESVVVTAPQAVRPAGFTLDAARIAQLQKETEAVSVLLANVFTNETVGEAEDAPLVSEREIEGTAGLFGLDSDHSSFLRRLIGRHVWSREELADMAADMELMLDGALEQINETMMDMFDTPLAEGEDPVEINLELLEKISL